MSVKKLKPTTPSQRFRIAPKFDELTKNVKPTKSLLIIKKNTAGRNNSGKITVKCKGGGHKQKIRVIDFWRTKKNIPAIIKTIEYDPIRTCYISLIVYKDGEKAYILSPQGIKVGDSVISGDNVTPDLGNCLPLKNMPSGTVIHNIELKPGRGGALVRSAGSSGQLLGKDGKYVSIKLPSGEIRQILSHCTATVGVLSNSSHSNQSIGKAGRNRWLNKRPRTRGVAMNPVDHPMGGGEGKASGGHPRSKTGLYAKGKKTRKNKKYSDKQIIKSRKTK